MSTGAQINGAKKRMYVARMKDVEEIELAHEGAKGVKVKYLLHKGIGAKHLELRLFTIEVGGYTPLERHEHEHEVFILHGKALVKGGEVEMVVNAGDAIFIPSNEEHQFRNIGEEKVEFLCTKQTLHL
jgi:quercetin dioxygenase-like cupin family protein